jgi:hypothetical protein
LRAIPAIPAAHRREKSRKFSGRDMWRLPTTDPRMRGARQMNHPGVVGKRPREPSARYRRAGAPASRRTRSAWSRPSGTHGHSRPRRCALGVRWGFSCCAFRTEDRQDPGRWVVEDSKDSEHSEASVGQEEVGLLRICRNLDLNLQRPSLFIYCSSVGDLHLRDVSKQAPSQTTQSSAVLSSDTPRLSSV